MNFIQKIDQFSVGMVHTCESIPLINRGTSLIILFIKTLEPYLYAILIHIPLPLSHYRQSMLYLYCERKSTQELFRRIIGTHDKTSREDDFNLIVKYPQFLKHSHFSGYRWDISMILDLINHIDQCVDRTKLAEISFLKLTDEKVNIKSDNSNLQEVQTKIAAAIYLRTVAYRQHIINTVLIKNLLNVYDNPSPTTFEMILKTIEKDTEADESLLKNLFNELSKQDEKGLSLIRQFIDYDRTLTKYLPDQLKSRPEFIFAACFSNSSNQVGWWSNSNNKYSNFPCDRTILFNYYEAIKDPIRLKELYLHAAQDNPESCKWLTFGICQMIFEQQKTLTSKLEDYKQFFACLAKLADEPNLKNFFDICSDEKNFDFASAIITFFAAKEPTIIESFLVENTDQIFACLGDHWLKNNEFLIRCLSIKDKELIDSDTQSFFLGLNYGIIEMNSLCENNAKLISSISDDVWMQLIKNDLTFVQNFKYPHILLSTHPALVSIIDKKDVSFFFMETEKKIESLSNNPEAIPSLLNSMPIEELFNDDMIKKLVLNSLDPSKLWKGLINKEVLANKDSRNFIFSAIEKLLKETTLEKNKKHQIKIMAGQQIGALLRKDPELFKDLPEKLQTDRMLIKNFVKGHRTAKQNEGYNDDIDVCFFKYVDPSKIRPTKDYEGYLNLLENLFSSLSPHLIVFEYLAPSIHENHKLRKEIVDSFRGYGHGTTYDFWKDTRDMLRWFLSPHINSSSKKFNDDIELLTTEESFFHTLLKVHWLHFKSKAIMIPREFSLLRRWLEKFPWLIHEIIAQHPLHKGYNHGLYIQSYEKFASWMKEFQNPLAEEIKNNPSILPWTLYSLSNLFFSNQKDGILLDMKWYKSREYVGRLHKWLDQFFSIDEKRTRDLINAMIGTTTTTREEFIEEISFIIPEIESFLPEKMKKTLYSSDGKIIKLFKKHPLWTQRERKEGFLLNLILRRILPTKFPAILFKKILHMNIQAKIENSIKK